MSRKVKTSRRRGRTRISAKHQITIPVDALAAAGLQTGDRLRVELGGPGRITFVREEDPIARHAGALTGVYRPDELEELRREWA